MSEIVVDCFWPAREKGRRYYPETERLYFRSMKEVLDHCKEHFQAAHAIPPRRRSGVQR